MLLTEKRNKKSKLRQRAVSMYAEPVMPPNKAEQKKATMDDMHMELFLRPNLSNRGSNPAHQQQFRVPEPEKCTFQKLREEFHAKNAANNLKPH